MCNYVSQSTNWFLSETFEKRKAEKRRNLLQIISVADEVISPSSRQWLTSRELHEARSLFHEAEFLVSCLYLTRPNLQASTDVSVVLHAIRLSFFNPFAALIKIAIVISPNLRSEPGWERESWECKSFQLFQTTMHPSDFATLQMRCTQRKRSIGRNCGDGGQSVICHECLPHSAQHGRAKQ
jgi:hypothetical protein